MNTQMLHKSKNKSEEQIAEEVYKGIFDNHGNLHNDPTLQIVIAALNVDIEDLKMKQLEDFTDNKAFYDQDVAEVRFEYYKQKRIAKLLQIENALTDKNADKTFMSLGINMKAYNGMSELSKQIKNSDRPDDYVIQDPHVNRLISSLSQQSKHISPQLQKLTQKSRGMGGDAAFRTPVRNSNKSQLQYNSSAGGEAGGKHHKFPSVSQGKKSLQQMNNQSHILMSTNKKQAFLTPGTANAQNPAIKNQLAANNSEQFGIRSQMHSYTNSIEFQSEILREKEKLNNFLQKKENRLKIQQQKQDKLRKYLLDKEKKFKKQSKNLQQQDKMTKHKFDDRRSQREHLLDLRKRDEDEFIKDTEDQYHRDLEEIHERNKKKEETLRQLADTDFKQRMQKKRMQSQSMFKDNAMRKNSTFQDQTRERSNFSELGGAKIYRDMAVEEQIQAMEYNWKRSSENQSVSINKKRAGASLEAQKIQQVQTKKSEINDKREYDVLRDFVMGASKRDKQLNKFQKEQKLQLKDRLAMKEGQWQTTMMNVQTMKEQDTRELTETIQEKLDKADNNKSTMDKDKQLDMMRRQQRAYLQLQDTKRSVERQKWQRQLEKMRIMSKHEQISEKVSTIKDQKTQQREFARMANEMRVNSMIGFPLEGLSQTKSTFQGKNQSVMTNSQPNFGKNW